MTIRKTDRVIDAPIKDAFHKEANHLGSVKRETVICHRTSKPAGPQGEAGDTDSHREGIEQAYIHCCICLGPFLVGHTNVGVHRNFPST